MALSIPAGWVDAAASASTMPSGSAKSEYVVGVQSKSALDGFNPNLIVFVEGPQQIDWAAGDGLSEPSVGEIANYSRSQVRTLANPLIVTPLVESTIAGEPAMEFAFTRTVDKCSCAVRQTKVTVKHDGFLYSGIFTSADKSTTAMAPILTGLKASWRWIAQPVAALPSSTAPGSYAPSDVLLALADLPVSFQPVNGFPSDVPDGATKVFRANSPSRLVLTQAVVKSDEAAAEVYRGLRAIHHPVGETSELVIPSNAQTLLPHSQMFEGVVQEQGTSFDWLRIVWRDGVTVGEIACEGTFSQSDIVGLALKQEAHTRVAAAPVFSIDQQTAASAPSSPQASSPSEVVPVSLIGVIGGVNHFPGVDVSVVSVDKNLAGASASHRIVALTILIVNSGEQPFEYNQLNWTIVDQHETAHYPREALHPAVVPIGQRVQLVLTYDIETTSTDLAVSAAVGPNQLRVPIG